MSLASFIKKQFIDILQWTEDTEGVLAWRFPMEDMEIQNGGMLIVRDSQVALFVNEGQIADVFGPGTYRLTTQTLPVRWTLPQRTGTSCSSLPSSRTSTSSRRACRPAAAGVRSSR